MKKALLLFAMITSITWSYAQSLEIDSQTNVSCYGGNDGAVTVKTTGGTAPYVYDWDNGLPSDSEQTALTAGTYTVTVTDDDNNTDILSIEITEPNELFVSMVPTDVTCYGGADGQATADADGGTGTYTYSWSDGQTTQTATALIANTYTITVTDENACTASGSVVVNEPTELVTSLNTTDVLCYGGNDGSVTANPNGGTGAYTYSWDNGQNTQTATNLATGNYSVTVTDENGCESNATTIVNEPDSISISVDTLIGVSCYGGDNGLIDISVTGGVVPYTYNWSNGGTEDSISNLTADSYIITVTDQNGCSKLGTYYITQPDSLFIDLVELNNPTDPDSSNGNIIVNGNGGVIPYSYSWSNGATNDSISGLSVDNYTVTITDMNGCASSKTFELTSSSSFTVEANINNVNCYGEATGSIEAIIDGGTSPYTYEWTGPNDFTSADSLIVDLPVGIYYITVIDNNEDTVINNFEVIQPDSISIYIDTLIGVSCYGGDNGFIDISSIGGVAPYTYNWSNGGTGDSISNLTAGSYTVTVTDQNGCFREQPFDIFEPTDFFASLIDSSNVMCYGGDDGMLSINVDGETGPFNYTWSNGATNDTISNLIAGEYSVTIIDTNNCSKLWTFYVTQPDSLFIDLVELNNPTDPDSSNGNIIVNGNGGTFPYTYNWSNGATNDSISDLSVDNYTVTITDMNGCASSKTFELTSSSSFTVEANINNVNCYGEATGSIEAIIDGGVSPYTYEWTGPNDFTSADSLIVDLPVGIYYITVIDNNEDTVINNFEITQPTNISVNITVYPVKCNGASQGYITTNITGGTPGYSYNWSNGETSDSIVDLFAGTYFITVLDMNNCSMVDSAIITEPTAIIVDAGIDQSINSGETASLDGTVSGGTLPYNYSWTPSDKIDGGDTTEDVTTVSLSETTTFTLNVTDNYGCSASDSIQVSVTSESGALTINSNITNVTCHGQANGNITINVTGGVTPYTYNWTGPNEFVNSDSVLYDLVAGMYHLTVTDAESTTLIDSFLVTEPELLMVNLSPASVCYGEEACIAQATATVEGGVTPYTINWSTNDTVLTIYSLCPDSTYSITITDFNGCIATQSVTVTRDPELTASIPSTASCTGACNAQATVNVQGGAGNYTYTWNNPDYSTAPTITDLCIDSTYSVTVVDEHNCYATTSVTIIESPSNLSISTDNVANVSCPGANDGRIDIYVSGGATPYVYSWSNGATTEDISSLAVDESDTLVTTYKLTVTDANGCESYYSQDISENQLPEFDINITDATCGNNDGAASISGITESHTTIWSTAKTGDEVSRLAPGTYSVLVKFGGSCFTTKYFQIDNGNINITSNVINATCPDCNDGQISLNLTGGTAPYSVMWDNGTTALVNSNLFKGTYPVIVTDANECQTTACISVGVNEKLSATVDAINTTDCGNSDGNAKIIVSGGKAPYTYIWSANVTNYTNEFASNLSADIYYCTITDANNDSIVKGIAIGDNNAIAEIEIIGTKNAACTENTGLVNIDVTGGSGNYTYLWSNGTTSQDLLGVAAGEYHLILTDGTCKTALNTKVKSELPLIQQICMVTVDTTTNHNLIVWEKEQEEGVDHFNVYRQNCNESYNKIGTVASDAITVFEDINSKPAVRSYSYRISSVDVCGNESVLSSKHKTMHLDLILDPDGESGQLIWNDYEGFPNPIFKLYVKLSSNNNWVFLKSIPNTQYYVNVGFTGDTVAYSVSVEKPEGVGCDAWNGNRATGGPYYQSTSNLEDEGTANTKDTVDIGTTISKVVNAHVSIYPNPTKGFVTIKGNGIKYLEITNVRGQIIFKEEVNTNSLNINLSNNAKGIYFVKVMGNNSITIQKIVLE